MDRVAKSTYLLAVLALLSACTPVARPTPIPTQTPYPTATLMPCPPAYERHVSTQLGFSACYPTGWIISEHEDQQQAMRWTDCVAPTPEASTGAEFKIISVRVTPGVAGVSEEEALETLVKQMMELRARQGREVGKIAAVLVDGRRAAEDSHEGVASVGTKTQQKVIQWTAAFPIGDKFWYIAVLGTGENRIGVEDMYRQFLAHFHVIRVQ